MLLSASLLQVANPWGLWVGGGIAFVAVILAGAYLFSIALRRTLRRGGPEAVSDLSFPKPSTDNPAAFMTASMQAVIHKLREQEKELEALHRRERERAQQTERLSEAVTRNMPAGLLLVNSSGLITSANPAAEAALGVQSLPYRRYTEVFGVGSPLTTLIAGCLSEGRTYRREEIAYTTPESELRHMGVTISPILGPKNAVSGALCLLSDLTELAALQRQVQVKESLAALGELSAGIAHEFKNALATISGYAQLIRLEAEGDVRDNANRIVEQSRALTHVVTEFLKFARPLELADEEVAVQPLVDRVVAQVRDALPAVQIATAGEFENISGDEGLLAQALLNLTRNAAEAAAGQPFSGSVTLHGAIEQAAGQAGQRISVSDNGPGIPPGDLTKIFVPFYTTKTDGTGLGLAIVQKIVLQHGGTVEARNRNEGGAEFIVWLPLSRQRSTAVDSMAAGI
jgi:signal transduction histidine kinase